MDSDGDSADRVRELYYHGCKQTLEQDPGLALNLYETAWELQPEVSAEEPGHAMALAAGLAVVTHTRIFEDYDGDVEFDVALERALDHRNSLTYGGHALLKLLADGESDPDPKDLREWAGSEDKSDTEAVEARAFATLIQRASTNTNE